MKTGKMKKSIIITLILLLTTVQFISAQKYDEKGFAVSNSIVGPKWGADSVKCVMNFSLYRENYRQWRGSGFENDAINYTTDAWRYVFLNCPLASPNTYIDGSRIIEHLYNNASDVATKKMYVDTLMLLYDRWIMSFGNDPTMGEGFILGRKGLELIQYSPDAITKAHEIFDRSISISKSASEPPVLFNYFHNIVNGVLKNSKDTNLIFEAYDLVSSYLNESVKNIKQSIEFNPSDKQRLERQLASVENSLINVDAIFEPFATCENLDKIYGAKYKTNPNDQELLEKLLAAFERKNCTPPLYYQASEALYRLNPTGASAFSLARMYYRLDEYSKAITFLNEAVKNLTENEIKADAHLLLADIYRRQGNFSAARSNALRAIDLRPGDGRPWMLIGDLYASSASMCTGDKVTSKAIYWAAVDKYIRARSVDESIASQANQRISSYTAAFPSTEDVFFHGYKKGDTYRVECWINETTTIRTND